MKKILAIVLAFGLVLLTACGGSGAAGGSGAQDADGTAKLTVVYQSSIGYAPLIVMMQKNLLLDAYDGNLEVEWKEMNNGAEINEGLVSGAIDIGCMGVPVAITGVMAGSPYKIATGLSAQPYSILSNQADINSLADITAEDQIAITNINSQPHILLAMACKALLGDARALDANLVKLGNADGYSSMLSGAVTCHMVISPYNFMEITDPTVSIHEIPIGTDIWPADNTALVTVVRNDLKEKNPKLYEAYVTAMGQAMEFIKAYPEETAEMLSAGYDADASEILEWMTDSRSSYSTEIKGVMNMANFMVEEGFLENGPASISELAFDNVVGE